MLTLTNAKNNMDISDSGIFSKDRFLYQLNTNRTNYFTSAFTVRIYYHIAFWIMLFLLTAVSQGYLTGALKYNIICFGIRLPFIAAVVYFNLYLLLPLFYYKGKLIFYVTLFILSALFTNAFNLFIFGILMKSGILPTALKADSQFTAFSFIGKEIFMITVMVLTTGIKLSKDYFLQRQKAEEMEREQLTTELSFLKSQLQPHFFFNTLNNLYALTLKKSDLAPEVVLKLSDFMSYVLYETDQEKTSLKKEISYIQNFIDLESLRFGVSPKVIFEINAQSEDIYLPPLLLLPFIENSFKHSPKSATANIEITIQLQICKNVLDLTVINPSSEVFNQTKKGGIGLRNVKRRLDLTYGQSYTLFQERKNNQFITKLHIQLS
ncbi:histidine kinase [Flavobacterium cupreum]|uniref:Histidine kinase n=2 Tax=Flavobacterium TaxID=237 RepID=A0A4Y7UEI4_9FLAO|nr:MULTISPECIES: sensor histidine kinase [Flavobacterium]RUT67913.1 histidine kinase [Flavobacterium cupreum]TCN59488.1 histidine kinase [Flavobacterium circumlabens]TEB44786.1 histidine kinase [Flavobacterium circumlabens]